MEKERDPRLQCAVVFDNGQRCQNDADLRYQLRAYLPKHDTSIETYTCEDCFRRGLKKFK